MLGHIPLRIFLELNQMS